MVTSRGGRFPLIRFKKYNGFFRRSVLLPYYFLPNPSRRAASTETARDNNNFDRVSLPEQRNPHYDVGKNHRCIGPTMLYNGRVTTPMAVIMAQFTADNPALQAAIFSTFMAQVPAQMLHPLLKVTISVTAIMLRIMT